MPHATSTQCGSEACAEFLLTEGEEEADPIDANGAAHAAGCPLVDPNRRSGGGGGVGRERPLNSAARLGRTSLVLLLLSAGADPAATDRDGETAVHAAARCGQAEIIKALAQASGGRPPPRQPRVPAGVSGDESRNRKGDLPPWWFMVTDAVETATFAAAVEGHAGVLRSLLAVGALETSRPNAAGDTPMGAAALAGHSEVSTWPYMERKRFLGVRVWVSLGFRATSDPGVLRLVSADARFTHSVDLAEPPSKSSHCQNKTNSTTASALRPLVFETRKH